jgi:hypothetical protein
MDNNIIFKVSPVLLNDGVEFDLKNYEVIEQYTEYIEFTSLISGTSTGTTTTLSLPAPLFSNTKSVFIELVTDNEISFTFNNGITDPASATEETVNLSRLKYLSGSFVGHNFVVSTKSIDDTNITWRIYK